MDRRGTEALVVLALLLCTVFVYLPAIGYGFVADDTSQILSNPHIHSWRFIPSYFTSHVWSQIQLAPGEHAAPYFRPVFLLWLLANYLLFGYSTAAWHASAILLHVIVTLLVYLLAKRLTHELWLAATAALFFALHPTHIEAVAWVSGATEPLVAAPFLGAVLCYVEAVQARRKTLWMAASLLLYAVAILAKETAIMLPAILIAYDLILRPSPESSPQAGRRLTPILKRISGYALLTAAYWVLRSMALRDVRLENYSLATLLYTWPSVAWFYVKHLLWPTPLSLFYNVALVNAFASGLVLVRLLLVVIFLAAIAIWATRNRVAAFAALWGVLLILPPFHIRVFIPYELVHDRYLYLPSVGFCMLLAVAVWRLARLSRRFPQTALAAAGAIAIAYAAITLIQSRYWSDEVSLFTHSFQVGDRNWYAERNFAYALGRTGHCDEAMPVLAALVDHDSTDAKTSFALGSCYFHKGNWRDAEEMMRRAAALSPHYQQPRLVLATIRLLQGRIADAEQDWDAAVRAEAGGEELSLHYVHGEILKAKGDLHGAAQEFRKELLVQPNNPEILGELATVGGS
jgi:hypothetical protein